MYGTLTVNQSAIDGSNTLQYTSDLLFSGGYGVKLALVLGLGIEGGAMVDKNLNIYLYFTGSIGVGIETPATTKTDLSTGKYLAKSKSPVLSFLGDSNKISFSSATTADICLGVIGTYDCKRLLILILSTLFLKVPSNYFHFYFPAVSHIHLLYTVTDFQKLL